MIRLELDSGRRRGSETERDEVLLEVNLSLRGYNDPDELGDGLWDVESEKERKRSKLRGGGGGGRRGDERGQKWKNLSVKMLLVPRESDRRSWYRRPPVMSLRVSQSEAHLE